jgi:hypothetical protein
MADDADPPKHEALQRSWQGQDPLSASAAARGRRRSRFVLLIALFLALVSFAVALLLFIRPPRPTPFFLTLNIADYNDRHFPVRTFGQQDSALLMRHFPANLREQPVTQSKDLLRKQLYALKDRPATPLVVHVAALGLVRDEKVYLLPGDADPDDPESWVEMREVIDAVESCPAKEKLLLLDMAHALFDPRLGVLSDRVAQTLEDNLRKSPPSFYVLMSCAGGQANIASEALQSSAFAYYVDQGMQGNAPTAKPGIITVTELAEFVKARVDRWAQMNAQVRQTPVLLGKGVDFTVVQFSGNGLEAFEKPKLPAYPDVLQKSWEKRDELRGGGATHLAPRLLTRLEARLLRRENRWQGGAAVVPSLTKECDDLIAELQRAVTPPTIAPRSLAATVGSTKENAILADSLLRSLTNPNDPKKLAEELVKKLQADKGGEPAQQAYALLDALYRVSVPTQEHLLATQTVLSGKLPFAEIIYVRRLADFAKSEYPETWPPDKVRAVLLALRSHQTLLTALQREPEFLPWMMPGIEEADTLRREGEKKLLSGRSSTWAEALKELQTARNIYDKRKNAFDRMQSSRAELDRAFAELPAYAAILCDWPEPEGPAEQAWCKAAKEAVRLQTFFNQPPKLNAKAVDDLDTGGGELKQNLDELDEMLRIRIHLAENGETAATLRQIQRLLDCPLVKTPKRLTLIAKQRELAAKLHDALDALDRDDNQERKLRKSDIVKTDPRDTAPLRGGMSLALLRLAGTETKDWGLDCAGELTLSGPERINLEKDLHAMWGRQLLPRWRSAEPDARGDALNRMASPWEQEEIVGAADRDWSCVRQAKLRESYVQWLKTCYQTEGRSLKRPQDREARDFFLDAAQGLRP